MDRLYADLDRGSAEMDRLMAGIVRPGDLRLVDILTLVWPEPEVVVVVVVVLVCLGNDLLIKTKPFTIEF